jgi:CBS domain-containing protein
MIDLHVGEIMTKKLVTVTRSQSLADAGRVMTNENVKSVVVSDAENRPVGILTSTDFVQMATDETTPTEVSVADYMTRDIVTTTSETVVYDAADLMLAHNISHLPVVGDDGRLTGIVTTTDVATYVSGTEDLLQET